jgi:hypothetical protein
LHHPVVPLRRRVQCWPQVHVRGLPSFAGMGSDNADRWLRGRTG